MNRFLDTQCYGFILFLIMYPTIYLGALSKREFIFLVGQGVDSGPSDIGHELHAKIEEAAEKALALITHAGKYP